MTKIYIVFGIIIVCSAIVIGEPIISYENGPTQIYSNLNKNWWQEQSPASTYRQNITPDGRTAYENKLDQGPILNSYLSSNVNNLDLGNGSYARTNDSWRFTSSKKTAVSSTQNVKANINSSNYSNDTEYRGVASTSDGTAGAVGGFYASSLFWGDDDEDNYGGSSSTYIYITDPTTTPVTNSDIPVAPAPGSILLGAIGVSIVGFLRNRKIKSLS